MKIEIHSDNDKFEIYCALLTFQPTLKGRNVLQIQRIGLRSSQTHLTHASHSSLILTEI